MWECESCGTHGIAGDLVCCPTCGKDRDTHQAIAETVTSQPDQAANSETEQGAGPQSAAQVFVGERGPELWDKNKSLADNLAATPDEASAQDGSDGT